MIHSDIDKICLEKCLKEIELKVSSQISLPFSRKDFLFLSDDIYKKTNVLISISTLRRIWTNNFSTIPQLNTLNALAIYMGYENWNHYKSINSTVKNTPQIKTAKSNSKRRIYLFYKLLLSIIFLSVIGFIANHYILGSSNSNSQFSIKQIDSLDFPNVVTFEYCTDEGNDGELMFQPIGIKDHSYVIPGLCGKIAQVYYLPGCYTPKLYHKEKQLTSTNLTLYSNGWMAYAPRSSLIDIAAGVYFTDEEFYNEEALHIKPETVESKNLSFHSNVRNLIFILVQDFKDIYNDAFKFSCEIKNDYKKDKFHCQRANVGLLWKDGIIEIPLVHKGYKRFLKIILDDIEIYGTETDLSYLETDISEWKTILIEAKNKKIKFYIDGLLVKTFDLKYEKEAIKGIKYTFHGCGSARNIKLYNHQNKLVYQSNFDTHNKTK